MIRTAKINDLSEINRIYTQVNITSMIKDVKYTNYDFIEHIKSGNINVYKDEQIFLC